MSRFTTMIAILSIGWLALTAGCSDDPDQPVDGVSDAASDAATDGGGADSGDAGPRCMGLFGAPNERTGLTDDQCRPACDDCDPSFAAPSFTADDLDWMRTRTFAGEFAPITEDPYGEAAPPADGVCGVLLGADDYALETYSDLDALEAAGAQLTHWGACGACSTLENFAVYAGTSDLTQPVRQCGIDNASDFEGNVGCLEGLGFDLPCAQIWAYNTRNTRQSCLAECIAALGADYNLPDGSLNDCLACDEAESGPVFKAVAGRSRRNSGLASAICRPCSSVQPVPHDYLPSR